MTTAFETARAVLNGPDWFPRFRPGDAPGLPLSEARPGRREGIIIFQRGDQRRALLSRQMAYHHVAQGELAGEPYLVTF